MDDKPNWQEPRGRVGMSETNRTEIENGKSAHSHGIRMRGKPSGKFCWQDNETYDVFQPIIGPYGIALYTNLSRNAYDEKVKYTLRGLAKATSQSKSTVDRNLKVIEHVGMVRLTTNGGNRESLCELLNLKDRVQSWGTPIEQARMIHQLVEEVKTLRRHLAGKIESMPESQLASLQGRAQGVGGKLFLSHSQRDASVSLDARQRPAGETRKGSHLLLQDTTPQNVSPPTPSHSEESLKGKGSSNDDKTEDLVIWARTKFTGVIDDLRGNLFETNRPQSSHLANGGADWQQFGFGSLAVEAVIERAGGIVLTISANNPAAAQAGIDKYSRRLNASLRKWYECEVEVIFQLARPN
jgi:hypothetical protein